MEGWKGGGTPHTVGSPHQRRPALCVCVCEGECHNVVRRNALVFSAIRPLNMGRRGEEVSGGGAEKKNKKSEKRKCFYMVIRSPAGKTEDRRLRCYTIRKISFRKTEGERKILQSRAL